jgi:hypothetical protein
MPVCLSIPCSACPPSILCAPECPCLLRAPVLPTLIDTSGSRQQGENLQGPFQEISTGAPAERLPGKKEMNSGGGGK